ncbi:MAG: hypothetical protein SGJ27_24030 [Candidatus Melainabacteria bacterium]|nr:hypothetical protein [Candidatus Melainabacteria bacterium]
MKRSLFVALSFGSLLIIGASIAPSRAETVTKTTFQNPSLKSKILGKHMLSLQWLQFTNNEFGSALVTDKNGMLMLKGEQQHKGKGGGYLKVDGRITEVNANSFKFNGKILTQVETIADGKECVREGDMTFLAKGKRKYWRLQEMKSPCSEVTDYVDLYF